MELDSRKPGSAGHESVGEGSTKIEASGPADIELDGTELDRTELDRTELDSTEPDSTEPGGGGSDGVGDWERVISGHGLRFVLVGELQRRGTMTVAEMVQLVAGYGFVIRGRASKVISDSLRWEVGRGRVVRLARGVYRYGRAPASTARRIRLFARRSRAWITAVKHGERPPPTPLTPWHRKNHWKPAVQDPFRSPWADLTWLWTM